MLVIYCTEQMLCCKRALTYLLTFIDGTFSLNMTVIFFHQYFFWPLSVWLDINFFAVLVFVVAEYSAYRSSVCHWWKTVGSFARWGSRIINCCSTWITSVESVTPLCEQWHRPQRWHHWEWWYGSSCWYHGRHWNGWHCRHTNCFQHQRTTGHGSCAWNWRFTYLLCGHFVVPSICLSICVSVCLFVHSSVFTWKQGKKSQISVNISWGKSNWCATFIS